MSEMREGYMVYEKGPIYVLSIPYNSLDMNHAEIVQTNKTAITLYQF